MNDLPMLAPVVTGKGRSTVIAEAFAAAAQTAPRAPFGHHLGKCKCTRCVYIIGHVSRTLRALKWSYAQIGEAIGRDHTIAQYHCKPAFKARKNQQTLEWISRHPDYRPPSRPHKRIDRSRDQRKWDNLGASHDPR